MSFTVLVVPEDPTHNGAILKPLVGRILQACGKAAAKVVVLQNPRVKGYENARDKLPDIVNRYSHFDLILFLVDADGHDRSQVFTNLEGMAAARGVRLICCAAVQEVEAWLLAGHTQKLPCGWEEVRADTSVKENIFEPFLIRFGDQRRPDGGRKILMEQTLTNYAGLLERCPELRQLEERIRAAV